MVRDNVGNRSGGDRLADIFQPLYEYLVGDKEQFKDDVDTKLGEALRDDPVELFLSRATAYGAITGFTLWMLATLAVWAVFSVLGFEVGTLIGLRLPNEQLVELARALRAPLLIITTGLTFGVAGFLLGFASPLASIYFEAKGRKREINHLMPDVVAFMYALSIGGMNQLEIFESVSRADDVYGAISEEFEVILNETRYFGIDYRTSIHNRALETPSTEFSQFLTDMLSILNSGGNMTDFLDDKRRKYMRTASQQQEKTLETLELFGEMYMTLSLFPLLFIILLVIMSMVGSMNDMLLYLSVYGIIPMVGISFLVLISTVKQDDPGDGFLTPEADDPYIQSTSDSAFELGVIEEFEREYEIIDTIHGAEGTHRLKQILSEPHTFFKNNPNYTFALTVPTAIVLLAYAIAGGMAPLSYKAMQEQVVWSTFLYFYLPMYITSIPYMLAYESKKRSQNAIMKNLSENLRKLASANDTGQTLLEAFGTVSNTSSGNLAEEFEIIHNKVKTGTSMKQALIEFNNKYYQPRLARTMKLIAKAQETSSQITPVLQAAADSSEQADDMEREQKNRTRMQVAIILMTYVTLLAVMVILKVKFLDVMAGLASSAGGGGGGGAGGMSGGFGGVDVKRLSLMFFHAVTLQALISALIAGYMRTGKIQDGVKYVPPLTTIALIAWMFVA